MHMGVIPHASSLQSFASEKVIMQVKSQDRDSALDIELASPEKQQSHDIRYTAQPRDLQICDDEVCAALEMCKALRPQALLWQISKPVMARVGPSQIEHHDRPLHGTCNCPIPFHLSYQNDISVKNKWFGVFNVNFQVAASVACALVASDGDAKRQAEEPLLEDPFAAATQALAAARSANEALQEHLQKERKQVNAAQKLEACIRELQNQAVHGSWSEFDHARYVDCRIW